MAHSIALLAGALAPLHPCSCQVCDYGASGATCVRCTGGKVSRGHSTIECGESPSSLSLLSSTSLATVASTGDRPRPAKLAHFLHCLTMMRTSRAVPSQRRLRGRLRRGWLHRRGRRRPRVHLSSYCTTHAPQQPAEYNTEPPVQQMKRDRRTAVCSKTNGSTVKVHVLATMICRALASRKVNGIYAQERRWSQVMIVSGQKREL